MEASSQIFRQDSVEFQLLTFRHQVHHDEDCSLCLIDARTNGSDDKRTYISADCGILKHTGSISIFHSI